MEETLIERVLRTRYPSVRQMYTRALWLGVVYEDDILSDYSLGVLNASEIVSEVKETHPEDFLHYRGLLEVQRHMRVKRQKSTVSQCQSGHTYSFNKGRTACPKCNLPFEQYGKFLSLEAVYPYIQHPTANHRLADIRDAVLELDVPEGQKRILKALVSDSVVLSEEHLLTATAKLTGVSRQRVHQVVNSVREQLRALLVV